MTKEKVNYQEVYDLYLLCSETKELREFCADYGVRYEDSSDTSKVYMFMSRNRKTVKILH